MQWNTPSLPLIKCTCLDPLKLGRGGCTHGSTSVIFHMCMCAKSVYSLYAQYNIYSLSGVALWVIRSGIPLSLLREVRLAGRSSQSSSDNSVWRQYSLYVELKRLAVWHLSSLREPRWTCFKIWICFSVESSLLSSPKTHKPITTDYPWALFGGISLQSNRFQKCDYFCK